MNKKMLNEKVAAKADENVEKRIELFESAIWAAARNLYGDHFHSGGSVSEKVRAVLEAVINNKCVSSPKETVWPKELWEDEEEDIMTSILSTMDTLQEVLLVTPKEKK